MVTDAVVPNRRQATSNHHADLAAGIVLHEHITWMVHSDKWFLQSTCHTDKYIQFEISKREHVHHVTTIKQTILDRGREVVNPTIMDEFLTTIMVYLLTESKLSSHSDFVITKLTLSSIYSSRLLKTNMQSLFTTWLIQLKSTPIQLVNSLAPGWCRIISKQVILNTLWWLIFRIVSVKLPSAKCQWPKSILFHVMTWYHQATSQAITWANVDPDVCHHMASLGRNWGLVTPYGDIDMGQHWLK